MTEQLYTIHGYDDDPPDVRDDTREANERIAEAAKRLHFVSRIPFICECSDPSCRTPVLLHGQEYAERRRTGIPIILPRHAVAATSDASCRTRRGRRRTYAPPPRLTRPPL